MTANKTVLMAKGLWALGILTLVILHWVGLGYLSLVTFDRTAVLTEVQLNLTKLTIVITWIGLGLGIPAAVRSGYQRWKESKAVASPLD